MTDDNALNEAIAAREYWEQKIQEQQGQQAEPVPESVQYAPPVDANRPAPKEAVAKAYYEAIDNGATSDVGMARALGVLAAGALAGDKRYLAGSGPTIFGIEAE
jgi:hypothetical protein